MRRRIVRITLTALAVLLLPTFVFAQSGAEPSGFAKLIGVAVQDGRLIAIRCLQIFWFLGFLGGAGFAGYAYYQYRKVSDDLMANARYKSFMIWGGVGAGASLLIVLLLSLAYWGIERTLPRPVPLVGASDDSVVSLASLSSVSDFQKIKSVYPENNGRNIPRNVSLLLTLSEPIVPASISDTTGNLNTQSVILAREDDKKPVEAVVELTNGNTTVKITPKALLGAANTATWYSVLLTQKILRANGSPLLSSDAGFPWRFEVSGFSDNTPPFVQVYLPLVSDRAALNSLAQVVFSEPIDPGSVTPETIEAKDASGARIPTTISLGNGFTTATITPQNSCGANLCGDPMFCFPKSTKITIIVHTAKLTKALDPQSPNKATFPYTGIVDAAGNSLDGGGELAAKRNNKSEGIPADDFSYTYTTGETMDLTPPALYSINPGRDMTRIGVTAPLELQFSKLMDLGSINASTVHLTPGAHISLLSSLDLANRRTKAIVKHDQFKENTVYSPDVTSDVRDMSQNCFSQCLGPTQ